MKYFYLDRIFWVEDLFFSPSEKWIQHVWNFGSLCIPTTAYSISEPFTMHIWKKSYLYFHGLKGCLLSLQQVELLYLFSSGRNRDNLNFEFMELDLENNWILEFLAVDSTGRTQFHPICSLISSSKTYLSIKT